MPRKPSTAGIDLTASYADISDEVLARIYRVNPGIDDAAALELLDEVMARLEVL